MTDDGEDNIVHFAPRPAPDSKNDHIANPLNLRRELHHNALTKGLVGFDEFSQAVILQRPIPRPNLKTPKSFEPRPWSDADDTALAEHFNSRGFRRVGRDLIRDVIDLEARGHPFHPVRDYLDALVWDRQPRLSRFLLDHCAAAIDGDELDERQDSATYIQAVTRAFFIAAVARVFQPGCKADCMLILEGPQGALKSRLLRTLAVRDEWFSDSLPHDLTSKDARAHLAGRWLVEMGEIAQFRRSEIETVKSYLSCQFDKYRPPYGRSDISVPRQCVFIGTTNAETYLIDPTGNRRFWPIKVGTIRLGRVGQAVEQLWAEAVAAYRDGEAWWLSPKLERLAARAQDSRVERDAWHDQIAEFVASRLDGATFTTAQIFSALNVVVERRGRVEEMRVGNVLRQLGCERTRESSAGRRRYVYRRCGAAAEREEEEM